MALIIGAVAGIGSPTPPASAAPDLDVGLVGPGSVLIGKGASFTLTATNDEATAGYNTGFRVVLPAGVTLSSSSIPATTFSGLPTPTETTLVWENVNDSQPSAAVSIDFSLDASPLLWPVGTSFAVTGEAYTSSDARIVPRPDGTGAFGSYTGSGSAAAMTSVAAVAIAKAEPSEEQELLRGIHDHNTVYTLTVENNPTNPTNNVTVHDHLPAGLEFLACGTVDNTTDAPTFSGN
ncbi:MAG: hypothetical protein ACR2QO_04375, partial [Acidimicrobiales bacterium]